MNLRERAGLIATVSSALSRGEHTLTVLPDLLKQLLEEGAWREFETKLGKHVTYDRFEDFVVTPPLSGLGVSMEFVRRIAASDPVTRQLLEQVVYHSEEGDRERNGNEGLNVSVEQEQKQERANPIMRRLQKDFPALHEQVLRGEKTRHAAAVEAKICPSRIAINLSNPQSAAETLLSNASSEFLTELKRLLDQKESANSIEVS